MTELTCPCQQTTKPRGLSGYRNQARLVLAVYGLAGAFIWLMVLLSIGHKQNAFWVAVKSMLGIV